MGILLVCLLGSGLSVSLSWPDPAKQHPGSAIGSISHAWDEMADGGIHQARKLWAAVNLLLCGGVIWLLRQRQVEESMARDGHS
jgi:hypothetical protein